MSNPASMDDSTTEKSPVAAILSSILPTPLASSLLKEVPSLSPAAFSGRLTVARFESVEVELKAMLEGCGIYDLGWRARMAVRGEDRLRWLSGMVTNAVQQLPVGEGNYSFFLNAQGRIQGDAFVYRDENEVLVDTTVNQVESLLAHLDRFIIMDDVTLVDLREHSTGIGLAGPHAARILDDAGFRLPEVASSGSALKRSHARINGAQVIVIARPGRLAPQFELHCDPEIVAALWAHLLAGGPQACGIDAVEVLRVREGIPRYSVDIDDRDLPQETNQTQALNFTKGCYLGQEIVERIRSRGAVHRGLKQFALTGAMPELPADLLAGDKPVGRLTSAVLLHSTSGPTMLGMGIVRTQAILNGASVTYNGGTAVAMDDPPQPRYA